MKAPLGEQSGLGRAGRRPGGPVKRTPIAHVVFPRPDPLRPVLGFVWDAIRALASAPDLEVDVLMPIPAKPARGPQAVIRQIRGASPWPADIESALGELDPRPILIPYVPLPKRSIESATFALSAHLLARNRALRPRLIQGSFLDEGGFAAAMAARVAGSRSIAVAHGSDVRAARGQIPAGHGRRRRALGTLRNASQLVAVSSYLAQELALLGSRCEVLRFTTTAARFPESPLPDKSAAPEVLFVGLIGRAKGVDVLLDAFARLTRKDARLRLIGSLAGDLDPRLEAERLGIGGRVAVDPAIAQEALGPVYARSSVVVLPSRIEGFGIVLVEALLVGRPVVGSDVGGIREIVDRSSGRLAHPADPASLAEAIDEVLALHDRRGWDTSRLRARALPMTWESAGPKLADLTRRVLSGAG